MNSISNLAKKSFKSNKTKSFLTVITIILATALLTSIGILYATIKNANIKNTENIIGRFHCIVKIENDKQFQVLKNNVEIEKAGEHIYLGNCDNEELGVNRIDLKYMDKDSAQLNNIQLEEGHMPEKSNEIVMDKWIIEKLNRKPTVGEKVHLKFMLPTSIESMSENKKSSRIEKDFVISGILKEDLYTKKYNEFQAIVSKATIYENLDKKSIDRQIDLRLKYTKNIEKNIYSIADRIGILHKDVTLNIPYLNDLNPTIYELLPFIIVALMFMLTAIVVIYNIFYLSITQKIQSFGLLSALGATKKQMRKVIMIDGFYTCSIGIPLGVLLGYGISYGLCNFVIPNFNVGDHFVLKAPFPVILVSAAVSLLTVIVALIRPARAASKIYPIQAIRFSSYEIGNKKKERKVSGEINIKKLAYINLWRYKKRTLMTIFSLSMSAMIFIIVSSISFSMDVDSALKETIQDDFLISSAHIRNDDGKVNPLNEDFIKKVKSINGVTKVQKINHSYACLHNSAISNNKTKIASSKECFDFYGFNDEMISKLKKNVVLGKISLEDLKDKNKVILVADDGEKYKFNIGDKVLLNRAKPYKNNNDSNLSENFEEIYEDENDNTYKFNEFTVSAIVNKNIEGLDSGRITNGIFIAHQNIFNKTINDSRPIQLRVGIEKSKYENVKNSLKNLIGNNEEISVKAYKETKEGLKNELKSMNIISYGIIAIITIIGVLNLINTRITSIITRKSEMGMIQAIGVSKHKMNKMLQLEGFYYSLISCLIAIVGGLGIGYLCFGLIKKDNPNMIYKFPLGSIIILIVIFTLVQIIITYLIQRMLNKNSIIDKIRANE